MGDGELGNNLSKSGYPGFKDVQDGITIEN
jgi:hypothetical protein